MTAALLTLIALFAVCLLASSWLLGRILDTMLEPLHALEEVAVESARFREAVR
ncbi:MAG: hypothetical protein R2715_15050 [Ilumatobacteraceae bacterium]